MSSPGMGFIDFLQINIACNLTSFALSLLSYCGLVHARLIEGGQDHENGSSTTGCVVLLWKCMIVQELQ